jgi:branched-chain amino acid transport system ATP-binding protein
MSLLQLTTVESGYHRRLPVLRGISLTVEAGQCVAILGSNGAGKSTLLKTIMGLIDNEPRKGEVIVTGKEMQGRPTEQIARSGIAYVVEGRGMFPELTVQENLRLGAFHRRDRSGIDSDLQMVYKLFPRLKERASQESGTMSGGEQQMLAIARALMAKPKLMMLDEPSLGLAPLLVTEIFDTIRRINQDGMGVLLVEQNASQALRIADYGYVLEGGRIVLEGSATDLQNNENVQELYLGVTSAQATDKLFVKRRRRWN